MTAQITPRVLARAIGTSESSIKRWIDRGDIRAARTAGGHRRIPLTEAFRFIRTSGSPIVQPDALGLAEITESPLCDARTDVSPGAFHDLLLAGNSSAARGVILDLFLRGIPLPTLFDEVISPTLAQIGTMWRNDERGIMIEHRAIDACMQLLIQLRSMLSQNDSSPIAIGGAGPGDPYILATLMAATVLQAEQFQSINLGPDTPLETLQTAAAEYRPTLVWLSLGSRVYDADAINFLDAGLAEFDARLVIGGRECRKLSARLNPRIVVASSMGELAAFAAGVRGATS